MNIKVLLLFFPLFLRGQKYNTEMLSIPVSEIVNEIAAYDVFTGKSSGFSGGPSTQYLLYLKLVETASLPELKELTDHPNSVMRCYAFDAICEKRDTALILEILKKHVTDDQIMKIMGGCVIHEQMAGDVMLGTATYGDEYAQSVLSEVQVNELDRYIIESNSRLLYKDTAIGKMPPSAENYSKIKNLVINENSKGALMKLAEYRKEQDVDLFVDFFNSVKNGDDIGCYAFNEAVTKFPHSRFFPLLKSQLDGVLARDYINDGSQVLYNAIASYGNDDAATLLSLPFYRIEDKQLQRHHLEFVYNAIHNFPVESYEELQWLLWEKYDLADVTLCLELFDKNPQRAYTISLIKCGIKGSDLNGRLVRIPASTSIEYPEELMLRTIFLNEPNREEIIISAVKGKKLIEFYLLYIQEHPDPIFIQPLFERLVTEAGKYQAYLVANTLLNYKSSTVTNKLLLLRRSNQSLMNNNFITELLQTTGLLH